MLVGGAKRVARHSSVGNFILPVCSTRWASSDPSPYPAVTIRGTPLPKIVGDHSWAQVQLERMGEKMEKGAWIERMKRHGGQREVTKEVLYECPDGIRDLVDELLTLSRFDVQVLTRHLQKRLGITEEEKMRAHRMPYNMPTGAPTPNLTAKKAEAAVAAAAKVAEKTSYDLMLKSFDATAKIKMIKEVRTVTGLGLKEAKDLVDKGPGIIKKGLSKADAEAAVKAFAEAGGVLELV
jgi:large subunit ribosomal protein L7/L12